MNGQDAEESRTAMINRDGTQIPQQTVPPAKKPQYLTTMAVTMVVFAGSTIIGWSSPALPGMEAKDSPLPITKEQGSWIGSLFPIGCFIGALPTGTIADLLGRKLTILCTSVPLALSWLMIYFAQSVNLIYIARLIGGIGMGAICTSVPMYISEISEDSIRGTLGSTFQLMITIGILYTYALGALVHYTLLPIFCGAIILIFLALFATAPESPLYLLKKDRRQQAETSLRKLRGPDYNTYQELHSLEKDLRNQNANKVSFLKAVTKRASILAMTICLGMMFFQQMSGINIVIFYSENIFKDAGSTLSPSVSTIIVGIAQVSATIVSAALIDRAGRKILLQFSGVVMCICLFILGYYFHLKTNGSDVSTLGMLPLVSVVVYILVFAVGFGPIPWMIAGEVLPPEIKSTGSAIAVTLNWLLAFTVTKIFQPLNDAVGPAVTYWLFAVICGLAFLFVTFVVIETKGKTLNEVQEELSGKKSKKSNVPV